MPSRGDEDATEMVEAYGEQRSLTLSLYHANVDVLPLV